MIKSLIVIFCAISISGYSQEKIVSAEEMSQKLINCQNSIATINEKISHIKTRIAAGPVDQSNESPQFLNEILSQLEQEKLSLERIQFSLQAYLKLPSTNTSTHPIVISKSDFEKYPPENQQLILANPEKYTVEQK